jgi:hypothetical protein
VIGHSRLSIFAEELQYVFAPIHVPTLKLSRAMKQALPLHAKIGGSVGQGWVADACTGSTFLGFVVGS